MDVNPDTRSIYQTDKTRKEIPSHHVIIKTLNIQKWQVGNNKSHIKAGFRTVDYSTENLKVKKCF